MNLKYLVRNFLSIFKFPFVIKLEDKDGLPMANALCRCCLLRNRIPSLPFFTSKFSTGGKDFIDGDGLPVFQYAQAKASDRRVYAWGVAETGALGNYTLKIRRQMKKLASHYHHPKRLHFAELYQVENITCGYGFSAFAVKPQRHQNPSKVYGCGINTDSQIGYHSPRKGHPLALLLNPAPLEIPVQKESKVIGLAAGRAHLLILTDNEGVFCLGNNAYGQCGRPIVEDENYVGSRVVHSITDIEGLKIKYVECGQDHSMFITDEGAVYACGWNADGQTGQGHYESHWKPLRVTGDVVGEDIIKVASSSDCILALNRKGEVFGWGNSEYGQFGSDLYQLPTSKYLQSCQNLGKIVDIATGGSFCLVLNENGQVYVWGYGILGKGPKVERALEPVEIPQVLFGKNEFQPHSQVTAIASGLHHMMAVTNTGDLYAWGHNRGGCLGLGSDDDQFFPLKVALGAKVMKVCCGVDHTMALCQPF